MKRTLSIFALLWPLVAGAQVSMTGQGSITGLAGMTTTAGASITADLWQTFELDTLTGANLEGTDNIATGTWSITDTGAKLSTSTSGQKSFSVNINSTADTGTRGLALTTGSSTEATATYTWASALGTTPVSFSFWVKTPTTYTTESVFNLLLVWTGDGGLCTAGVYDYGVGPVFRFKTGGNGWEEGPALTASTWYRIEMLAVASGTCKMRVYNEAGSLQGTELTGAAGGNGTQTSFVVGSTITGTGTVYFDNIIADKTDATFPLGQ